MALSTAISVTGLFLILSVLSLLLMPSDGQQRGSPRRGGRGGFILDIIEKAPDMLHMLEGDNNRTGQLQSSNNGPSGSISGLSGGTIFLATVKLGTPPVNLQLEIDTGGHWTWTQCRPCPSCYPQIDPIFDPSTSSTYANLPCSSSMCTIFSGPSNSVSCTGQTCGYSITYGDGSSSTGWVAKETLTLSNVVIPDYLFGCGQNNTLFTGSYDGYLGLSNGSVSMVSQTASQFGRYFSICLPSDPTSTGFLTFGKSDSTGLFFTPLIQLTQYPSLYGIQITGISVGGIQLPASSLSLLVNANAVIDSGTVISRLPPTVYSALRSAVRTSLASYPTTPAVSILDTCYDFSKVPTIPDPNIEISFEGLTLSLHTIGAFFNVSPSQACLAFAPNSADSDLVIYGNTQQRTMEIVYDVAGGKLGFRPDACS